MIAVLDSRPRETTQARRRSAGGKPVGRRADQVALLPIEYVPNELFGARNAAARIEQIRPASLDEARPANKDGGDSVRGLCGDAPLERDEAQYLFLRMNYLKFRAERLRRRGISRVEEIEALRNEALGIRNRILEANMRLLVSVARTFAEPRLPLDDFVSEGVAPLIRAIELFDVSRGYCFSTYATNALRNHMLRVRSRAARQRSQHVQADHHGLNEIEGEWSDEIAARRRSVAADRAVTLLDELTDREQTILAARFGLGSFDQDHTFQQIGAMLGLSKERVRVVANKALERLRTLSARAGFDADGTIG